MKTAESILTSLAEPILVLDTEFRAMLANPAFFRTMQIAPDELLGKAIEELIVDEHHPSRIKSMVEEVVQEDVAVDGLEVACILPSHTRRVMAVSARLIPFAQGPPALIVVELRDITQERDAEQRIQDMNRALQQHGADLEQINRDLDAFTHSVSHDLRTPLRLTNRIAHLLLHDPAARLSAGAIEKVHMILDSTQEMAQLIEDLLIFSRVGHEPMKKRRVDMQRLVREVLDELREEQQHRQVNIMMDELQPCEADRALLKQVLLNLLGNALKFTRQRTQAEIHIGCTNNSTATAYFVRDNGLGFHMSQAETMFLVFHRLHKAHSFEGSGVGLALVKRIIERHEGRIWAEGAPNQGATFYFTLGG